MIFGGKERLPTKTPEQILAMRRAGLVVGECLAMLRTSVRAGMTTASVDALAHEFITGAGGVPSFLGYQGYPATLCVSVNDEVVHGIPGPRVIADGDLVSIDCGAIVDGWHGDSAISLIVGDDPRPEDVALSQATQDAMWAGIGAFREGLGVYEIGGVIEDAVTARNHELRAAGRDVELAIVDGYTGHGIGRQMHTEPTVFNERVRSRGPRIRVGATVAIEPMLTLGTFETHELDDGWTVRTDDGSRAAHWEHTVALTPDGLWVLTALDGGKAHLEAAGLPFGPLE